jgi:iron(III) transport system substrate-binding protein
MRHITRFLAVAGTLAALAASPALAQSGKLVLYTSQPNEDAQQTVDAFKAKYPGVEVEWIRDGTTKVMAKLEAEFVAGDPQPDVLLIADTVTMEGLKQKDRLLPFTEADVSAFDPALYDKDKTYFSTKLITTGIVYNNAAEMKPASWKDLTRPEAKGQVVMPSPLTSGAALVHLAALTQNPDLGWDYYKALAEEGTQAAGGNGGILKSVAGGEKMYGFIVDYLPIRESAKGSPVTFVFPTEGVTAVTEPVAILKTAKNLEAAKAFVSFLLSKDGQAMAASQGYLPADGDVAPPEGFPPRSQIKLMPFDAAEALKNEEENKMKFSELFGG